MPAITVETDTATPWLRQLAIQVRPHRVAAEVGPRCTRLIQRNFRSLGANIQGWPSTHFYGRAAEATNWQEGFGFVTIGVNQIGVRQRLIGGDIKPVNAGALTIPAVPEAYGRTAREFDNLEFGMLPDPATGAIRPCLKERLATKVKWKKGQPKPVSTTTGKVAIFWLSKGVHQDPNPRVMPSHEQFAAEFDRSIEALMRRPELS